MKFIRPIQIQDLGTLEYLANLAGAGFTSLPISRCELAKKIKRSSDSFIDDDSQLPSEPLYLFVLQDSETDEVCGVCGIEAAIGKITPLYHFEKKIQKLTSELLGVNNSVETLSLSSRYSSVSEICSLFLSPHHRGANAGKLLSKSRFLFMAEFSSRFQNKVIAEMRGYANEQGNSPFWSWLQKHFLPVDFELIDFLMGVGKRSFIPELLPAHPIYMSTLPISARESIGKVHENTRPAIQILQKEGFANNGCFDLFDAGPTIEAKLQDIVSVKSSQVAEIRISERIGNDRFLLSNRDLTGFRALVAQHCCFDEMALTIHVDAATANALQLESGESARLLRL